MKVSVGDFEINCKVEGVEGGFDARLVAGAAHEEPRQAHQGNGETATHRASETSGEEAAAQVSMMPLVSSDLCWNRTALVATSMTWMNMKYCTRRSPSLRSSEVKTFPVM